MTAVFSSLPISIDVLVSARELESVKGLLADHYGQWMTADKIQSTLGWRKQRTAERVRRAVKELQLCGVPIVESHAGFTWATRVEMVDCCLEKERQRMRGLERTIRALENIRHELLTNEQKYLVVNT